MAKASTCKCSQLPAVFERDQSALSTRSLTLIEERVPFQLDPKLGNFYLTSLMQCRRCQQLWQIDGATTRGFSQVGWTALFIKLDTAHGWKTLDDTAIRVAHLANKHGGLGEEKCMFAGCQHRAVLNKAFCPHCLYHKMLHQ